MSDEKRTRTIHLPVSFKHSYRIKSRCERKRQFGFQHFWNRFNLAHPSQPARGLIASPRGDFASPQRAGARVGFGLDCSLPFDPAVTRCIARNDGLLVMARNPSAGKGIAGIAGVARIFEMRLPALHRAIAKLKNFHRADVDERRVVAVGLAGEVFPAEFVVTFHGTCGTRVFEFWLSPDLFWPVVGAEG